MSPVGLVFAAVALALVRYCGVHAKLNGAELAAEQQLLDFGLIQHRGSGPSAVMKLESAVATIVFWGYLLWLGGLQGFGAALLVGAGGWFGAPILESGLRGMIGRPASAHDFVAVCGFLLIPLCAIGLVIGLLS
jgi:hypothetical protein